MKAATEDLFGEPARTAELSQFFTPAWLARRAASWLPLGARVLEPSAGAGNLIEALVRRPGFIEAAQPVACELDPRWAMQLRQRFPWLCVVEGDFLEQDLSRFGLEHALMNPPYEEDADVAHVAHALEQVKRSVVAIVKSDFEFSATRDRVLWNRARVIRRAILVDRPDFGGTEESGRQGASRNYVVLQIARASAVGGAYTVREQRWRRHEQITEAA